MSNLSSSKDQQTAWIKTRSGKYLDLLAPEVRLISIDDIGWSLARTARFNGHTSRFYSVAEHCLLGVGQSLPEHQRTFLMHDAPEYVLGDALGPLKSTSIFDGYRALEDNWWGAIAERFGLPVKMSREIHETDKRMLVTEQRDLMGRPPASSDRFKPYAMRISEVEPSRDEIAEQFISTFYELTKHTVGAKR